MTATETPAISHIEELLAENGYEVTDLGGDVLRARDPETGIALQAALEGNVLYMSVALHTVAETALPASLMRKMLAGENGISTSAFKLYEAGEGRVTVTLNNFCTLQNMGEEDKDDVLSLANYLMADLLEARALIEGGGAA
ncbi:MAG TPA: hypothetical protein VES20_02035 [Bryobacteraceae bacterium]|nr:hypothetical protein [Bryobacteraceae bacterium]